MKTSHRRLYLILCLVVGVATSLLVNALMPLESGSIFALDLPDVITSPLLLPESLAMQSPINPPGGGGPGSGGSEGPPAEPPQIGKTIPDDTAIAEYSKGSFCPDVITPERILVDSYGQYFPIISSYYPLPYGYGIAGADHGGDGRGECPGTNDMLDTGLSASLSYQWNFRYTPDNPDLSTHNNEVQMVYKLIRTDSTVSESLKSFVQAYSDTAKVWILSNEPDRQDGGPSMMCPDEYAKNYHAFRNWILGIDDSAKIAIAAISQSPNITVTMCSDYYTNTREDYITAMLTSYADIYGEPMPIDIWTIHQYPGAVDPTHDIEDRVSEWSTEVGNVTSFIRSYVDIANGYSDDPPIYANSPVWLTEFGYHYGNPHDQSSNTIIRDFVAASTDRLESLTGNEKVDYWFWFMGHSAHTTIGCTPPFRYTGFLFEQVESQYGNESNRITPISVTENTMTIPCPDMGCEDILPQDETWDQYTYVYFEYEQLDGNKVYRVSSSSFDDDEDEVTLTLCGDIYAPMIVGGQAISPEMDAYKFALVRQRPAFDGDSTHMIMSSVGQEYVNAALTLPSE